MTIYHARAMAAREVCPGVFARTMHGDGLSVVLVRLEAGAMLPPHRHPQEQATTVLSGLLMLTINGKPYSLRSGMTAFIEGNALHDVTAVERTEVIDVFTPVLLDEC